MPPSRHVRTYDVHSKLGRHQVLDPLTLAYRRPYAGETIKPADHEPPIPVLDQEDLVEQGILLSQMYPALQDLPALGSCGGNTGTEAIASLLGDQAPKAMGCDTTDAVACEKYAIGVYSDATHIDEWHDQQFPSDDCGTSGLAVAKVAKHRGLADLFTTATTPEEFARDFAHGGFLYGTAWYQAWFEPATANALLDDIKGWEDSPVAGGHLIFASALEEVHFTKSGDLDLKRTIVRFRNHWTASWGDNGSFRISLDLYRRTRREVDIHQLRRNGR